jgi:2-(1,2-epoxy-1,2-dihydrophenyl)acetyl-CoA isomerase
LSADPLSTETSSYETILYEVNDGIARLTLNRPEKLNSMNLPLLKEAREAVHAAQEGGEAGVLVVTGAGRGFCAGADLAARGDAAEPNLSPGEHTALRMKEFFNPLIQDIHECSLPVICAVNGVAAGGGMGLALSGDITIAAKSATFVQVFTRQLGIIPDCGSTWYLPRHIGRARALGMAFLGEKLPAEQAERWGLIWKCVDDDALESEVNAVARQLADGPTACFAEVRKAFLNAENATLPEQLEYERQQQRVLCDGANFAEGVMAFLQKRKPVFKRG